MQNIEGKVAYITGGTKGIGLGIAKALVENGVKVAISGRNIDDVEKARHYLGKENVLAIQSDVRFFEDEQNAVEQLISTFGRLDIVIANAGLGKFAPIDEMSLEDWNAMIDTNLTGVFHTMKATVEALKVSKGYYISIASLQCFEIWSCRFYAGSDVRFEKL